MKISIFLVEEHSNKEQQLAFEIMEEKLLTKDLGKNHRDTVFRK